uniref:Uncharacterized protein n=1 Tax=Arion vulgaris TaxID=1028688 RepID=A0A0B6ZZQ8_9EUPU
MGSKAPCLGCRCPLSWVNRLIIVAKVPQQGCKGSSFVVQKFRTKDAKAPCLANKARINMNFTTMKPVRDISTGRELTILSSAYPTESHVLSRRLYGS